MSPGTPERGASADHAGNPRRRPRYAGTHPRRFDQRYKELDPASYPEIHDHVRAQGRTPAGTHVPVLIEEVCAALHPRPGDVVVDCTIGYGGHAREFLKHIAPTGRLIGLDMDAAELQRTAHRLGGGGQTSESPSDVPPSSPRVKLHRCHFGGIGKVLAREGLDGCDIIFADLGASSMALDDPARGFSYKHDGPLDMRMDDRLRRTAADLLAALSASELSARLWELADEPDHERIAQAIVERRAVEPITRTRQLARLVLVAKGRSWRKRGPNAGTPAGERHPAARTFQALRIIVNDEMGGLEQLLRVASYCLRAGGRFGIISFHSGEHRRIQRAFRDGLRAGLYAVISEDPTRPTLQEIVANPRSRAARFRWAEKNRH